jgi:hypothetical protein
MKHSVPTVLFERHLERRNFELYTLIWSQVEGEETDEATKFKSRQAIIYLITFESDNECCKYLLTSLNKIFDQKIRQGK